MGLILAEKTEVLRCGFFDVQNRVGLGRDEEDYHQAMKVWLSDNDIPFRSKYPHPLMLYGQVAHTLIPDVVAWDEITIELKAVGGVPIQPSLFNSLITSSVAATLWDYWSTWDSTASKSSESFTNQNQHI